jgi:hypothetical protein
MPPQRGPVDSVYVSLNDGRSWNSRRLPVGLSGFPWSMSGDPTLQRLCILSPAEPGLLALLCSQDEGQTWEVRTRPLPDLPSAFVWSGAALAYVNGGQVLVLRQSLVYGGGDLPAAIYVAAGFRSPWQRLPADTSSPGSPEAWTIVPASSGQLLAVSDRTALGSSDGGAHWTLLGDRFSEDTVVYGGRGGNSGGGSTWVSGAAPDACRNVPVTTCVPANAAATATRLLLRDPSGQWSQVKLPVE